MGELVARTATNAPFAVNGVGRETGQLGGVLRYVQTGNVQRYAVYLFVGVGVLALLITRF